MFSKQAYLGLLGVHHTGTPEPGLPLAVGLRRIAGNDVCLHALCTYPVTPALGLSRFFDMITLIPEMSEGSSAFLSSIAGLLRQYRIDYIVPGVDPEAILISSIQAQLADLGIQTLLPEYHNVCRTSKASLCNEAALSPYPLARGNVVDTVEDLKHISFPFLVKGNICDSYVVNSFSEAVIAFERISQIWGRPAIAQEFLEGDEYAVCALAGPQPGSLAGCAAIKKIGITEKGKSWMGVIIESSELTDIAKAVVRDLEWRGPLEIELRLVPGRGFVVFEINPRFPAWLRWLDCDPYGMVHLFIDLLLAREPRPLSLMSGTVGVRVNRYVCFPIDKLIRLSGQKHVEN